MKKELATVNLSFENFLNEIDLILSKYAPLKKFLKQRLKFKRKPWITSRMLKSI